MPRPAHALPLLLTCLAPFVPGCIALPLPHLTAAPTLRDAVGDAASAKPIRPGATRAGVHAAAAEEPIYADADNSREFYSFVEEHGRLLVIPFVQVCHEPLQPRIDPLSSECFYLAVTYNAQGIVQSAKILTSIESYEEFRRLRSQGIEVLPTSPRHATTPSTTKPTTPPP